MAVTKLQPATEVKERPVLFSGPMVRAILEGRKTQTRRLLSMDVVKPSIWTHEGIGHVRVQGDHWKAYLREWQGVGSEPFSCPYGKPGDRLWVRETWAINWFSRDIETGIVDNWGNVGKARLKEVKSLNDLSSCESLVFDADGQWDANKSERGFDWHPSIFMPRWASRLTLEITGVRVERLQDITEADAIAEGVKPCDAPACVDKAHPGRHQCAFEDLWNEINGKRAPWNNNPWVWVVEFKRVE